MRPTARQMALERAPVVNQRSRSFMLAEKRLQYVAVCLIGYRERVPRTFGDNQGAWPVRIAMSKKPREVAKKPDIESPLQSIVVLEMVWTESEAHAKRLKAKLDELLLGASADAKLRHGWRDVDPSPEIVWPILLEEALRTINRRERVLAFDEDERVRRIATAARGGRR